MSQPTDFNDLQQLAGRDEVRRQLLAALDAPMSDVDSPPAPPAVVPLAPSLEQLTLDQVLERFAWTAPDGKIWDAHDRKILKPSQLKGWVGAAVYKQWHEHDGRRSVAHSDVAKAASAAQRTGGGELGHALRRYVLLYPSQTVWDKERREVVALGDLKPKLNRWYQQWLEHPERLEIPRDKLVFDPLQQLRSEDGYINMFRGLPLSPVNNDDRCMAIRRLIDHLCNHEPAVFDWLVCWLALPLQRVGTKMATAVLMHSETQGTGKSLFWEGVLKPLYGEYAATLGQHQLESQYTDWRSQKLFGLFEEIFSRDQKYSHTGTLKHMITGATQRVEKKFVSGWEEANHMNAAFLSNEVQPFPVEPSDRRMLVVWPLHTTPPELQSAVLQEIAAGGIEAFYGWLLRRQLVYNGQPFDAHTKPPMTEAKRHLIDFGRPSWDVFHEEWSGGYLDVEFQTCLTSDLYQVYKRWGERRKESVLSQTKFVQLLCKRLRKRNDMRWSTPAGATSKGAFFIIEDVPHGEAQDKWLGQQVAAFRGAMRKGAESDESA